MKGHTTIELIDIRTGEREVHEDDNMMTKALEYYLQPCGFMNYYDYLSDLYDIKVKELLGGILLLDTPIQENAETVYLPGGIKMIGNGSVDTLSNDSVTEMGSYNKKLSGFKDDGSYVQVYDYTAEQANGTIACCCLTSRLHGYIGEGNSTSYALKSTLYSDAEHKGIPVVFGAETIKGNSIIRASYQDSSITCASVVGNELHISKYRLPISVINMGDSKKLTLIDEQHITLTNDVLDKRVTIFGDYRGIGYLVFANDDIIGSTNPIIVITIDINNSITTRKIVPLVGYEIRNITNIYAQGKYLLFTCRWNGKYDWRKAACVDMDTMDTNIIDTYWCNEGDSYQNGNLFWRNSDGVLITSYGIKYDLKNGEAYPLNNTKFYGQSRQINLFDNPLLSIQTNYPNDGILLYRHIDYIASINNLEQPIVKTPDKAMRVTYRITF